MKGLGRSKRAVGLGLCLWLAQHVQIVHAQEVEGDPVVAGTEANPEYKRTIDGALEEYKLGHFTEARSLFEHAHALDPNARTLRGLGMVEFELRHYVRAAELLEASLSNPKKPLTEEQRKAVADLLQRTRQFIASYSLDVEPDRPGLILEIDGKTVELDSDQRISLEAGEHTLRISAPDVVPRELHIDVQGGENQTLRIKLEVKPSTMQEVPQPAAQAQRGQLSPTSNLTSAPAAEPAHEKPVRPYASLGAGFVGVGGVALIAGVLLGTVAVSKAEDAPTKDGREADSASSLALAGDVAMGAGLACAVAGAVLLMIREKPKRERAQAKGIPRSLYVEPRLTQFRMRF